MVVTPWDSITLGTPGQLGQTPKEGAGLLLHTFTCAVPVNNLAPKISLPETLGILNFHNLRIYTPFRP